MCRTACLAACAVLLFCTVSCSPSGPAPVSTPLTSASTLELLVWHLDGYATLDRNGDGLAEEFKSTESRAAISALLAETSPETLVVLDLGDDKAFTVFTNDLAQAGLAYPFVYRPFHEASGNFALLSRLACASGIVHEVSYTVDGTPAVDRHPVGEVVFTPDTNTTIRIVIGHLQSKDFHPLGQYEMRRNEARQLSNLIKQRVNESPDDPLLVLACLNDDRNSAVVQQVAGSGAGLLEVADPQGDVWTYVDAESDTYSRIDYLLGNSNLIERIEQVDILLDPRIATASRHRPIRIRLKP